MTLSSSFCCCCCCCCCCCDQQISRKEMGIIFGYIYFFSGGMESISNAHFFPLSFNMARTHSEILIIIIPVAASKAQWGHRRLLRRWSSVGHGNPSPRPSPPISARAPINSPSRPSMAVHQPPRGAGLHSTGWTAHSNRISPFKSFLGFFGFLVPCFQHCQL